MCVRVCCRPAACVHSFVQLCMYLYICARLHPHTLPSSPPAPYTLPPHARCSPTLSDSERDQEIDSSREKSLFHGANRHLKHPAHDSEEKTWGFKSFPHAILQTENAILQTQPRQQSLSESSVSSPPNINAGVAPRPHKQAPS